jgi:hypothetical protein
VMRHSLHQQQEHWQHTPQGPRPRPRLAHGSGNAPGAPRRPRQSAPEPGGAQRYSDQRGTPTTPKFSLKDRYRPALG